MVLLCNATMRRRGHLLFQKSIGAGLFTRKILQVAPQLQLQGLQQVISPLKHQKGYLLLMSELWWAMLTLVDLD